MTVELKIKSKHLSVEAKIIKFEEAKLLKIAKKLGIPDSDAYNKYISLNSHRKRNVRNENRATFLARAFLANKTYSSAENNCIDIKKRNYYIEPRVLVMVNKYGKSKITKEQLDSWFCT